MNPSLEYISTNEFITNVKSAGRNLSKNIFKTYIISDLNSQ